MTRADRFAAHIERSLARNGVTITYYRGASSVEITAARTGSNASYDNESGVMLNNQNVDYRVLVSDLTFDGTNNFIPTLNDKIVDGDNGKECDYLSHSVDADNKSFLITAIQVDG